MVACFFFKLIQLYYAICTELCLIIPTFHIKLFRVLE